MKLAQHALETLCAHMVKIEEHHGREVYEDFVRHLLAALIGNVVYKKLMDKPWGVDSKHEEVEYTMNAFADIKTSIQESAAVGVQAAMTRFSGRPVEYYCLIKPVPEPVNKRPC